MLEAVIHVGKRLEVHTDLSPALTRVLFDGKLVGDIARLVVALDANEERQEAVAHFLDRGAPLDYEVIGYLKDHGFSVRIIGAASMPSGQ